MKNSEINIRDPFILTKDGKNYMYGTRAADFGYTTGGFDVYVSEGLDDWDGPHECFSSAKCGMNGGVNWAPEVHEYGGAYYMFATFTQPDGLRGTYILRADDPAGPFLPHSEGAVTPRGWECLDGTLHVEDGVPYLVFCHEHTQIIDGTICYIRLKDDLTGSCGEPVTLFHGSAPYYVKPLPEGEHYVTDGPFMYRTENGALLMIWSTILENKYAECLVRFGSGSIKGEFEHLPPLIDDDGGHGMIFSAGDKKYITFHTPNRSGSEHPAFAQIEDSGDTIVIKSRLTSA